MTGRTVVVLLGLIVVAPGLAGQANREEPSALARRIDAVLEARWGAEGLTPSEPIDDAGFLRRVWLDIGGRIPPAGDVQSFLADTDSNKRARVVDDLLAGPNYVVHFGNVFTGMLTRETDTQRFIAVDVLTAWLRDKLVEDASYAEIVHELLTEPSRPGPNVFFASAPKPEEQAATAARVFLGRRIGCAQCHAHPFDDWEQTDFWSFAAFFARTRTDRRRRGVLAALSGDSLLIPGTKESVEPRFLDGSAFSGRPGKPAVATLADWMTKRQNPWFDEAAANRLWGHFFGRGIVEPIDDFSAANPPSVPELLGMLAAAFREHDHDLKFLIRAVTRTRAYQLSSMADPTSEQSLFSRMHIRGLSGLQLYNSISQATGGRLQIGTQTPFFGGDSDFLTAFDNTRTPPAERQRSVLQALRLMNGDLVKLATSPKRSKTLDAIAGFPGFTTGERIDALFVTTLSRLPRPDERSRFTRYVDTQDANDSSHRALGDVFWALLNCAEFSTNH